MREQENKPRDVREVEKGNFESVPKKYEDKGPEVDNENVVRDVSGTKKETDPKDIDYKTR